MKERKVQIAYTDRRGSRQVTARWLSQVHLLAAKVYDNGGSEFQWRLHGRAPWRRLPPGKVQR